MADSTSTEQEAPAKKAKAEPEIPVAESGPAIDAATAAYPPATGNWSDPPELAEDESNREGSHAAPPEEEVAEERAEIVKEAKERRAKALEENDKQAQARAAHDAKATA